MEDPRGPQRAQMGAGVRRWLASRARGREKSRRGCVTGRRAPLFWRTSGRRRGALAAGPVFPPAVLIQPPAARSWRGAPPPALPGRSGSPHLANRTVPCSSGLRLTARQLCRISSGSGRSMPSQGCGAQGWDPRGVGAVTARVVPSPQRRGRRLGLLSTHYGPSALAGRGSAAAPSLARAERMRAARPRWRRPRRASPAGTPGDPTRAAAPGARQLQEPSFIASAPAPPPVQQGALPLQAP